MFGWVKRLFGRKKSAAAPRSPVLSRRRRASYDLAQDTDENERHWTATDDLSARSANSLEVRKALRERSRYEYANNSYYQGMALTLANDLIGTGPRVQLQSADPYGTKASKDRGAALRQVERAWGQWCKAVKLPEKLRTLKISKAVDGEAFAVLTTNDALMSPVQLDLQLVECDRVTDPFYRVVSDKVIDGIEYDSRGNPVAYLILDEHPGDIYAFSNSHRRYPAASVIHWFRCDRPGQVRGVPEFTPSIPLFAQLRRYTLAVIAAAETAADFAAVLYQDGPPDEEADQPTPFSTQEIERRMLAAMPIGWKLEQLKAEQPTTTYEMFKAGILNEIARCANMPYNVAAGNSSSYNYASGRLDHQTYFKSCRVEGSHLECAVLYRLWPPWLDEAVMVPGLIPAGLAYDELAYAAAYHWDGWEHVDPLKEANANRTLLASRQTTLAELYAAKGQDWEEQLEQRSREIEKVKELGLPPTVEEDPGQAWSEDTTPGGDTFDEGAEGTDDDEEMEESDADDEEEEEYAGE